MNLKLLFLSTACLGLVACGGSSSSGSTSSRPVDSSAPSVSFSPATLTVVGGQTGSSTLSATDNVGLSGSASVTCTNGGTFSSNTFTAPDVNSETTSVCTATARDAAGNTGRATLTVTITPAPDTSAPALNFEPPTLTVESGQTGMSTLIAVDNRGIVSSSVSCTNGGVFDTDTFTAPTVTVETISVCTVSATDAAGNVGTATLTVTIPEPDTTGPVLTLPTAPLAVDSGQTASYVIAVSDNSGETIIPDVVCDNGGSWANNVFTAPTTETDATVTCNVTVTDSAGNVTTDSFSVNITGVATPNSVTVSGIFAFDLVPFSDNRGAGLDYSKTVASPGRGITIQARDANDTVIATTATDGEGRYSFELAPNTDVRIFVIAQMKSTEGPQWDVRVVDNTSDFAIYAAQGSLVNTGVTNSTRNLKANSGWDLTSSSYTSTRQAGPFAILNPIYDAHQKIAAVDPDVILPPVNFNWSVRNTDTGEEEDVANGLIGTSYYYRGEIFILGDDDSDTDEYDSHVIVHEWGHYLEDNLSRSDSIGGPHGPRDRLDPRLAFGEGFGNALSGIITDEPLYRDSFGVAQGFNGENNVELNTFENEGWFNERSVQSILYDIYDSASDGADSISAGFGPIYDTLTADSYKNTPYFTTIFHFADQYKMMNSGDEAAVDALLTAQTINGTGPSGSGETNNGGIATTLPVFKVATVGGGNVEICSTKQLGERNKHGVRSYIEITPTVTGGHTFTMIRKSGATVTNPDFVIYEQGIAYDTTVGFSTINNSETWNGTLKAGVKYIVDAFDRNNTVEEGAGVNACYNFSARN